MKKRLLVQLLVSLCVGVVVFVLSCLNVWRMSPGTLMNNTVVDYWTTQSLREVNESIAQNMKETHAPPKDLHEIASSLRSRKFINSGRNMTRNGWPIDGWGRPLYYAVQGTSYTLVSYGRNGKRGGTGFDRDSDSSRPLYVDQADLNRLLSAPAPMPTLHQFLFELPSGGMVLSCVLTGILASLATWFLIRSNRKSSIRGLQSLVIEILVTIAAAIFFATIIMQLHIPTSH